MTEDDADLVTIIIPVFNGADFLKLSIDSALAQTWPSVEVLVVDDGSTDGGQTRAIAESYGQRIRHLHKENGGVGSALNFGLAHMRGRYVSWLSHDDLYDPRKVELQMLEMRRHDEPVVVIGDYDCMHPDGSFLSRTVIGPRFDPEKPLWAVLEGLINGCTLLVPKICFDNVGGFDPSLPQTQDYDCWYRLAQRYPFAYAPGPLVRYRVHSAQASQTPRHLDEASLLWMRMLETLDPAIMRAYEGSELRFMIRAHRFVNLTGYSGAKSGVPALVDRWAKTSPLGVVLVVKSALDALRLIAELEATGLAFEALIFDVADHPLDTIALANPGLASRHSYCRVAGAWDLASVMRAGAVHLSTELILILTDGCGAPQRRIRTMYERLSAGDELDALLLPSAGQRPTPLGPMNLAMVRRSAIDAALKRAAFSGGAAILHALALDANIETLQ